MHVLLRGKVDAQVGERAVERRDHLLLREHRVPLRRAEQARDVPALRLREPDADAAAEELVGRVLVEALRRVEERAALLGEIVER